MDDRLSSLDDRLNSFEKEMNARFDELERALSKRARYNSLTLLLMHAMYVLSEQLPPEQNYWVLHRKI